MKTTISDETRRSILDAAWEIMSNAAGAEVGQTEIAAKAGVSRQTVYLAFGGRAALMREMLRNKDRSSPRAARLYAIGQKASDRPEDFLAFLEAWLDYLPDIYPVGIRLDQASTADPAAAAAWDDRMKATLLAGMKRQTDRLHLSGHLAPGLSGKAAAELVWSLIHPASWRLLVVECGWLPAAFRRSRLEIVQAMVLRRPP